MFTLLNDREYLKVFTSDFANHAVNFFRSCVMLHPNNLNTTITFLILLWVLAATAI